MIAIDYAQCANALRFLSIDAVEKAGSGHPGMPMGMADVATVLFRDFLKFNPKDPMWPDRDRFVLSAGHGSMLLYSLLYLTGYERPTVADLKSFRQLGACTPGHPEYGHLAGVETTTGPLGQGLATAVGMAIAERKLAARLPEETINHYTYVIASDGDLMEGISQEAISLAGHLKLSKMIVLYDDNNISIDGNTSLSFSDQTCLRFDACGWATRRIDGHDFAQISQAISAAQKSDKPTLIACKTTIAKGSPNKANTSASHGSPLGSSEIDLTRQALNWPHAPFYIPEEILAVWRTAHHRCIESYVKWQARAETLAADQQKLLHPSSCVSVDLLPLKQAFHEKKPSLATRQSSQDVLNEVTRQLPILVGGSADLTGSNNTKAIVQTPLHAGDFSGNYLYYGVREHAMAAIMNGLSLHGPFIPYGGTFLVFSDYLRPALRLSALMNQGVIYVLTHDSIGLGEDGPTHQPVEHLAALRAMPNVLVFRPADAIETADCWSLALQNRHRPSVLALSRQNLPTFDRFYPLDENPCQKGAYLLQGSLDSRKATLIATGSEVALAIEAHHQLLQQGIETAVISLPCWELFAEQSTIQQEILLGTAPRIAIEAATDFGWHRFLRPQDHFIGMKSFGASAPAKDLYAHFGITVEAIINRVKERI